MSIADKLALLHNTKQEIKQAIETLGLDIGDIPFSQYPFIIDSMVLNEGEHFFFAFQGVPNTRGYGDLCNPYIGGKYASEEG